MKRTPFAHILVLTAFLFNSLGLVPIAYAQDIVLPKPGVMVHLSPPINPTMLKGLKVHPDNPFQFDFILDKGDSTEITSLQDESARLIKYFLASLTVPAKDLWVNLSPYERDRIIPTSFGMTEMGRDLLAEDYMLKQITASLIYPEDEVGRKFWKRVYEEAQVKYHTTNIPVNTFNKVWIVPNKAVVYENAKAGTAYVVESTLKVMLEQDYLSLEKHTGAKEDGASTLGSQIVREIVIPELTREVNEGKNFAPLRQVYSSLILASWYKKKIKDSILSSIYADKNKTTGISIDHPQEKLKIYEQYLQAFKKGVYNYIKEDIDPATQERIPRKYFSGGFDMSMTAQIEVTDNDQAMKSILTGGGQKLVVSAAFNVALLPGQPSPSHVPDYGRTNNLAMASGARNTVGNDKAMATDEDPMASVVGTPSQIAIARIAAAQGLSIGQVLQIIQEGFNSRFSTIPLTRQAEIRKQYIDATVDMPYESLAQMLNEIPEAIAAKLEKVYMNLPPQQQGRMLEEIAGARAIMEQMKMIYQEYMMDEDSEGQQKVRVLLSNNYHNFLHNLMVTFSALKLTENVGMKRNVRDLKVVFLAAMLHDFHVRFVTVKDRASATPALVEETILQLQDLLMGKEVKEEYEYTYPRTSKNNSAYGLRLQKDDALKEAFRHQVSQFLGAEPIESIWPEVKTLILRTDFASDVPPPAFMKDDMNGAAEARQEMESAIEDTAASPEAMSQAIMAVTRRFQERIDALNLIEKPVDAAGQEALAAKLKTSRTWLDRQRDIELNFLEGLSAVPIERRFMVYRLATRLEISDQSASGWMGTEKVAEDITNELKNENSAVVIEGSYTFFYKGQLLNPRALHILRDLPMACKINFYRNMEYFAHLSKAFGGDKDWEGDLNRQGFKSEVLVSLGLYMNQRGKIYPLSFKTNIDTMLALLHSSFGKTFTLEQLHALAIHPSVSIEEFKAGQGDYIFKQGEVVTDLEANEDIYVVTTGVADIYDKEKFLVSRMPGEMIGEIGAVMGGPRSASVKIGKDKKVAKWLRIPRTLFQGLFLGNDAFRSAVADVIRERLTRSGLESQINEDRLNPIDMKLGWSPAVSSWRELGESKGKATKISAEFQAHMGEIADGIIEYLRAINVTNKYAVDMPNLKMIVVTKAGRHISIYQDPTDGQLVLAVSYRFFEGTTQQVISRLGWAVYHQLLYLSAKLPKATSKQLQIMEESFLLLRDLLADQEHHKVNEALLHIQFLIDRTADDQVLHTTLEHLKKLYVSFLGPKVIDERVIKGLLSDMFQAPVDDPEFMSMFLSELKGRGIKNSVDTAMTAVKTDSALAVKEKGGIDFNSDKMNLQIQNAGQGINFKLDPAMLVKLQNAAGFTPIITSILPLIDLKGFLGINDKNLVIAPV